MMKISDYDGIGLSGLIVKKELSPTELLQACIENTELINPSINAVVYKFYDQAKDAALKTEDLMMKRGRDFSPGPFFGVPFLIKNLLADCKGTPFSDSCRFVEGHISQFDAEIMRRLKNAGLIIFGRTNASEFGIQPTTEPAFYGPTLNPWNTAYSPGGSSGGSAAAVASSIVPAAHGNDGGGSLRIAGSCCGVFALKPTRARTPLGPEFGDLFGGLVCEHALTRSVRDSAALLDITHGPQTGDPYYAPPFEGSYLEQTALPPGKLKIALLDEVPEGWNNERRLHPDCRAAVEDAGMLCGQLKHNVEVIKSSELSWPDLPDTFLRIFCCSVNHQILYWERKLGRKVKKNDLEPETWDLYRRGMEISGGEYLAAVENLQLFSRKISEWYTTGKWDMLLSPTMRIPPTEIGAFSPDPSNPGQWIKNAFSFVAFTRTQNVVGQPAMSMPLYWNDAGLPVGVQFAGKTGSEDLLFRLASEIEESRPWFDKRPAVSV